MGEVGNRRSHREVNSAGHIVENDEMWFSES